MEYGCDVEMRPIVRCGWKRIDPSLILFLSCMISMLLLLVLLSSDDDDDVADNDDEFLLMLDILLQNERMNESFSLYLPQTHEKDWEYYLFSLFDSCL